MKKRYVPLIAFTLAAVLVGSVAYASEKKKKTRLIVHEPSEISEEDLKVELLAGVDDQFQAMSVTKATGSKQDDAQPEADKEKAAVR